MSFGNNLQNVRKRNNLSQEDLAEMLGVSRQAVSKWELDEGYPEVDKLLLISEKLSVSLDSLMGSKFETTCTENGKTARSIKIYSPHEGVIVNASKVRRSQQFKGGKNSPKYALYSYDADVQNLWGTQNNFLGWYRDLEDISKEIEAIQHAFNVGDDSYTLQYSVKCKQILFRTVISEE